ncbi:hypothetical protein X947_5167 [Burkholderia pseudomallei MSHR7334]|nr:hypothetical protein DP43_4329 [Burkholderia pseudomallei]KGS76361.1 hypothetical protein X947_5167 [Burkholderia pseudomallei MSHR7334]
MIDNKQFAAQSFVSSEIGSAKFSIDRWNLVAKNTKRNKKTKLRVALNLNIVTNMPAAMNSCRSRSVNPS